MAKPQPEDPGASAPEKDGRSMAEAMDDANVKAASKAAAATVVVANNEYPLPSWWREPHPVAEIFPMESDAELLKKAASIVDTRGLLHDLTVTTDNLLLDGRNRQAAFLVATHSEGWQADWPAEPAYQVYEGDDPLGTVIALNVRRRQMTSSQRAMSAARLATAKRGHPDKRLLVAVKPVTIEEAAQMFGTSKAYVKMAKRVLARCVVEIQDAIDADEVAVRDAVSVVGMQQDQQIEALNAVRRRNQISTLAQAVESGSNGSRQPTQTPEPPPSDAPPEPQDVPEPPAEPPQPKEPVPQSKRPRRRGEPANAPPEPDTQEPEDTPEPPPARPPRTPGTGTRTAAGTYRNSTCLPQGGPVASLRRT